MESSAGRREVDISGKSLPSSANASLSLATFTLYSLTLAPSRAVLSNSPLSGRWALSGGSEGELKSDAKKLQN